MEIFPAIDIMNGQVVRLTKGDFDTREVYSCEPLSVLKEFKAKGARNLHAVDLDGAKDGRLANFKTVEELTKEGGCFIEIGGGIRDERRIEKYLEAGVGRVILGTAAIKDFEFTRRAAKEFAAKIAVGVDANNGFVAIEGWKTVTQTRAYEFCLRLRDVGVSTVIYTDIATDGAMKGTNIEAYKELKKIEGLQITASGGISSYEEIETLRGIGLNAAILGKALYKGAIDLARAVRIGDGYDN